MRPNEPHSVQQLVQRIEAEIAGGAVPAGAVLGTEGELCARYGIGPTTFRQAARVLEASDLAAMRRGNGGGLVVRGYSLTGAAKTIAAYLEFAGADVVEMQDILPTVFRLGLGLARDRMTLEQADDLRARLAEIPAAPLGFQRGMRLLDLFRRIVASSGNPIVNLAYRVAQHFYTDAASFEEINEEPFRIATERAGELIEALIARDTAQLYEQADRWLAMRREHMARTRPPSPPATLLRRDDASGSPRNLSEQLAHRMLREIRLLNWPVGARLGAEPELMARYDVSRATLRQSVRQLEQYFAVQSRRGPGGGIFVTSPDPERVLGLAVAALRERAADWSQVRGFLPDLVGVAIDLSGRRGHAAVTRLARVLRAAGEVAASDQAAALRTAWQGLAETCANSVAAFLFKLVAGLEEQLPPAPGAAAPVRHLLGSAAQAFESNDPARGKRALLDLAWHYGLTGRGAGR